MPDSKISTKEAIMLVITVIVSHTIVTLPTSLLKNTKSAVLLNMIFVSIMALLIAYIIYILMKKFQGQDIIDISEYLGGKWCKTIIGTVFIIYFITSSGILLRNFCEGLKIIYFPNTNILFIMLAFIITICITNTFKFSANCKTISIILPFVIFSIILLFVGNLQHFSFERIFPILGDGFFNTFILGIGNLTAFGGISCLYIIPPLLKNPENMKKIALTSIGISAIYLIFCVATILFMFAFFQNIDEPLPLYTAASYIEFGTFFQRLDAIFLLVWMLEICCYLCIASQFSTIIIKKIANLKHSKPLFFIFPLLILSVALIPKNYAISRFIGDTVYNYVIIFVVFILSLLLLFLANIKKKKEGGNPNEKQIEQNTN